MRFFIKLCLYLITSIAFCNVRCAEVPVTQETQSYLNLSVRTMEDIQAELLAALEEFETARNEYAEALAHKDSWLHTLSTYIPYHSAFFSHKSETEALQKLREQFQLAIIKVIKAGRAYEDFVNNMIELVRKQKGKVPEYFSQIGSTLDEQWQLIKQAASAQKEAEELSIEKRAAYEGNLLGAGALVFSTAALEVLKEGSKELIPKLGLSGFAGLIGAGALAIGAIQYLLTAERYKTLKTIPASNMFKIEKALQAVKKSEDLLYRQKEIADAVAKELALRSQVAQTG